MKKGEALFMEALTAFHTDIGNTKDVNQDALLIKEAYTNKGKVLFLCVCDGMGGLSQGEMASTYVTCELSEWFDKQFPKILGEENFTALIQSQLTNLLEEANVKLSAFGNSNGIHLGTTCTAMIMFEETYYIIHIGDSRVYEIEEQVRKLTKDHTVLAREIELGRVSPQNAEKDARGSVLLQCIGASKTIEPQYIEGKTRKNAVYMLCTDGFRHKVSELEFLKGFHPRHMTDERIMKKQCEYFVQLNMGRKERDNITVLLSRIV